MDNLLGQTVKGYEIREQIGVGSFGVVYKVYQPMVGREVAIKVIAPEYANQPEFIRRFEYEAQLVARLEHIHIVPLYDYWRDPGGAFLVMRYLRGGSLRDSLKNGAWELEPTARIVDQICSALAVAHRNGVIHRDLKPDNVLLDEDGNAYLADFGIALGGSADRTSDGLAGSPIYSSPEQIKGASVTAQTDLYAMGMMIYEILTGTTPLASSSSFAEIVNFQLNEDLPPIELPLMDEKVMIAVNGVIRRATHKDAHERYPDAMALARAFREAINAGHQTKTWDTGQLNIISIDLPESQDGPMGEIVNPYKGLRAFQQADSDDFFGREQLTDQLAARLLEQDDYRRFLAVVGPSGSGKSSVVRAGLIPALRRGLIAGSSNWFVVEMIPGPRPLDELAAALTRVAVNPLTDDTLKQLRDSHEGLLKVVEAALPADPQYQLLLVIDQFEEVFTLLENEDERNHIMLMLIKAALDPQSRLRVIVTLRADFYDRPLLYPRFGEMMRRRTEVVLPLKVEELRRAIVSPAERVGMYCEDELITAIIDDVGEQPGALPLMQYALTELFERRQGRRLALAAYKESGGVLGALARRAEELYKGLDEAGQAACQQLFLRLVTLGEGTEDTRRRVQRGELSSLGHDNAAQDTVLDEFSKYRLLTFDRDPTTRDQTVEVAHEALIRTWGRLREWLNTSREDLRTQRRLQQSATEWINAKRDRSFLTVGARLTQFENLKTESAVVLNSEERDYLEASLAERDRLEAAEKERSARELDLARQTAESARKAADSAEAAARAQKLSARRLRALVWVMALALAVGVGLLVVAIRAREIAIVAQSQAEDQRQQAETARTDALTNLTRSDGLRYASLATNLLQSDRNVETAALLAVKSLNKLYTAQGDDALRLAADFYYATTLYAGAADAINGVVFSPDGQYVASGGRDGKVLLWERSTGKLMQTFEGHTDAIVGLAFSSDGSKLVTGSFDKTCILWDVATGKPIRTFTGTEKRVRSVNYSPDGRYVVAGTGDWTAWMWDADTGKLVHQFGADEATRHKDFILSVAFSPDSKILATGSGDKTVRLWDVATGEPLELNGKFLDLVGHTAFVESVRFSPDGSQIVTASDDKSVRVWDIHTGMQVGLPFIGHDDKVYSAQFSPDGKFVISGSEDKTARVWSLATGKQVQLMANHTQGVNSVAWSPDGTQLLTGSSDHSARLWEVHTGPKPGHFEGHQAAILAAVYSPDGKWVMTGGEDQTVKLWDAQTGEVKFNFTRHQESSGNIVSLTFSPDSKYALTGGDDGLAWLIDVATGEGLHKFVTGDIIPSTGKADWTGQVAFSPDGKLILTSNKDGTITLWDAKAYINMRTFKLGTADKPIGATAAVFSPDGKTFVTGSDDSLARLWDAATAKQIAVFAGHTGAVFSASFSPDGKLLATGSEDGTVRIWDVATTKEVYTLTGHVEQPWVAFSPDGKLLATGNYHNGAGLWDVATGKEIRTITGHLGPVRSVDFSPDGKFLLTGSNDTTARLWQVDYNDLIASLCDKVLTDFTDEQRTQFDIKDTSATCPKFAK
ncbi:MAG: protein kinase [Anaerolineae bacterium]|nr:protein kinase [Anaerolineae bacterium]